MGRRPWMLGRRRRSPSLMDPKYRLRGVGKGVAGEREAARNAAG